MSSDSAPSDPAAPARQFAKPELPKRFYKEASVREADGSFALELDGRGVKTPGRRALSVGSARVADALAREWAVQGEFIDPTTMPVTRIVNSAIDGVAAEPEAVRADIVAYAASDLVCYRAEAPVELAARQAEFWDPEIEWLRREFGAPLVLAAGVIPVDQPAESLSRIEALLGDFDPLALTALHSATALTGSAVLALSVAFGRLSAETAWRAAHVDEDWQIAQWGEDAEATARREQRWREMAAAAFVLAERTG